MRSIYKQLVAIAAVSTAVCWVHAADDTDRLVIVTTNGSPVELNLTEVGKLSFDANKLSILMANGTTRDLDLTSIDRIEFDLDLTTGVDKIEAPLGEELHVGVDNHVMTITHDSGDPIAVAVYSINGAQVLMATGQDSVTVDFSQMTPGVYVIKANNKTIKYLR